MNGVMIFNPLGQIAAEEWFKTSPLRPYDEFVVMPNHVHGILHINANITTLERALRGNARSSKMISPNTTLFHLPAFYLITAN
ncbi:MAG: hypothetical protein GYA58_00785 [Anaerolineaceae bacterium]|nr:hypothetical protein [Anaerolineaceae bacterium]